MGTEEWKQSLRGRVRRWHRYVSTTDARASPVVRGAEQMTLSRTVWASSGL